ncbi:unnamed protein product [Amaranthus hypochondriacus]
MYDGVSTNNQTPVGLTESFSIRVGLHQGSALNPFIFAVIMDEITKSIWETIPWCMLFADDIVLAAETKEEANSKLDEWREAVTTANKAPKSAEMVYQRRNKFPC